MVTSIKIKFLVLILPLICVYAKRNFRNALPRPLLSYSKDRAIRQNRSGVTQDSRQSFLRPQDHQVKKIVNMIIEDKHESEVRTRLRDIPKSFEIQGYDANAQFKQYSDRIQGVALQENLNVIYKVQVDVQNLSKHRKRKQMKKRSKKYNVPLKKTSMKLSNFEVWLRKMAEETSMRKKNNPQNYVNQEQPTTKGEKVITTTKQIHYKYKPIILKSKTNYTKHNVKPVRKRVITLGT